MEPTPRWLLRFESYKKALALLRNACEITAGNPTDLERDGIIQRFEFTFELAWKVLKDFLEFNGIRNLRSPADVRQTAFKYEYISDGVGWYDMQEGRNTSSHEYDEAKVIKLYAKIVNRFLPLLEELKITLQNESGKH